MKNLVDVWMISFAGLTRLESLNIKCCNCIRDTDMKSLSGLSLSLSFSVPLSQFLFLFTVPNYIFIDLGYSYVFTEFSRRFYLCFLASQDTGFTKNSDFETYQI